MVGIVIVSHSDAIAAGVVELARQMADEELALEPAGGLDELLAQYLRDVGVAPPAGDPVRSGVLGTDPRRILGAIERAMSADGVLVLMDLGSAMMSVELAIERLTDAPGPVVLSEAPLVEGAVAAAVAARGGSALEDVAAKARGALAMKASQLGV
jgi:dihydroxyacetone kinase DhaKLM complex PTS-EIIA-like component DhaM